MHLFCRLEPHTYALTVGSYTHYRNLLMSRYVGLFPLKPSLGLCCNDNFSKLQTVVNGWRIALVYIYSRIVTYALSVKHPKRGLQDMMWTLENLLVEGCHRSGSYLVWWLVLVQLEHCLYTVFNDTVSYTMLYESLSWYLCFLVELIIYLFSYKLDKYITEV